MPAAAESMDCFEDVVRSGTRPRRMRFVSMNRPERSGCDGLKSARKQAQSIGGRTAGLSPLPALPCSEVAWRSSDVPCQAEA